MGWAVVVSLAVAWAVWEVRQWDVPDQHRSVRSEDGLRDYVRRPVDFARSTWRQRIEDWFHDQVGR